MWKYGVLVFRQQELGAAQQLALAKELAAGMPLHATEDREDEEEDENDPLSIAHLMYYNQDDPTAKVQDPLSELTTSSYDDHSSFEWHTDALDGNHSGQRPLSMLYSLEAPECGGETLFFSGYGALDRLPPELLRVAEVGQVHYRGSHSGDGGSESDEEDGSGDEDADGAHVQSPFWHPLVLQTTEDPERTASAPVGQARPMVVTHPFTGRRSLWVSPGAFVRKSIADR